MVTNENTRNRNAESQLVSLTAASDDQQNPYLETSEKVFQPAPLSPLLKSFLVNRTIGEHVANDEDEVLRVQNRMTQFPMIK